MILISRTLNAIIVVAALAGGPFPVAASSSGVTVESRATSATVARPEVHLLLKNEGGQPTNFLLWIAYLPGQEKPSCAASAADEELRSSLTEWEGMSQNPTSGVIPARGWVHRSLLLGAEGLIPPCSVPYRLDIEVGDGSVERIEGTVKVPKPEWSVRGDLAKGDMTWDAMVETDEIHENRVVLRLLVRHTGSKPARLLVTDRRLRCSNGERLGWALHHAAVQGEDVGPFSVPPGGWAVFAAPVRVPDGVDLDRCAATMEISADTEAGLRVVETVDFPLSPKGFFAGMHGAQ